MSEQYPGGFITKSPVVPTSTAATGIWNLSQQAAYQAAGTWPAVAVPDAQFNYVTMLLHGDGTNGAQNNTFLDSSTNNFTITRNGNTTQGSFSPYGSNWSNYFASANSDYLKNASGITLGTGSFTLECWYNFSTGGYFGCVGDDLYTTGIAFRVNSSGNFLITTNGSATSTFGTSNASFNAWHHVAFVRSSGTITCYLDGVSQGTLSNSGNISGAITVAGEQYSGTFYAGTTGYISNIRVTNTAVYSGNFTPSTTPLTAVSGTQFLSCQSNRFVDNSTNALALTTNGTPSVQRFNPFGTSTAYSTATIGGSGYFDGTGDYLSATVTALGTGNATVEFWMYALDATATYRCVYDNRTSGGNGYGIFQYGLTIEVYDAFLVVASAAGAIKTNSWNHVALVRNSGTCQLYINGVASGSSASNSTNLSSTARLIGNSSTSSYYYYGYVVDLRENATAVYTTTFTPPTSPIPAISGTQLLLNMQNAAIYDNAMMNDLETVGNAQISTSVKKYGTGSMYFDGSGDSLITPAKPSLDLGAGNFTIEAWINITANTSYVSSAVISKYSSTNTNWMLRLTRSGSTYDGIEFDAEGAAFGGSFAFGYNTWYHVAVVRNGSSLRIYVNGNDVGGGTASFTVAINAEPIRVGMISYTGYEYYWYGYIDDLRITKGYARYTSTFTPPTAAFPNIGPT